MAGYDDVYDVRTMEDGELRELIVGLLREERSLDADGVEVSVRAGTVRVRGRLGTEQEIEIVETLLLDRLGVENIENELVVDELVRHSLSEAADDAAIEEDRGAYNRRSRGERTDPEAEHLLDDVEADLYGTENVQQAIEGGDAYTPPDVPREEGTRSRERH
ncbi:MAG TPA: BON domain-containing protein [Longimicrobiales bacterium]